MKLLPPIETRIDKASIKNDRRKIKNKKKKKKETEKLQKLLEKSTISEFDNRRLVDGSPYA